ncbi:MAG: LON peptidase substrate-binding domain-containing protein [Gemmatimonadaceae bacterium]
MAARTIPLFPLPLVLFPGVTLPLHIFEHRYRRMLADCQAGDRQFGVVSCPTGTEERSLPSGHVGCIAGIDDVVMLPDGRSNITVRGGERFSLERFVQSPLPYHVGEVSAHADVSEPEAPLADLATQVREAFTRVVRAARTISGERADAPALPADPALLAFGIASMIDLDIAARQHLLASRSPTERLREIGTLLDTAVGNLEERAATHERARTNGRGTGSQPGHAT